MLFSKPTKDATPYYLWSKSNHMASASKKSIIKLEDSDYVLALKDGCIHRVRSQEILDLIAGRTPSEPTEPDLSFLGSVSYIPTTGNQLKTITTQTDINYHSISFKTGTTEKTFIVAIPEAYSVSSIINSGTSEDLTNSFDLIDSAFLVQAVGTTESRYKLYAMQIAVPFSNNYTINITLS